MKYGHQSISNSITSHTKAKVFISQYLAMVKKVSNTIYYFIKYDDNGGFADLSVKKEDIHFLFIRHQDDAIVGDVVEPADLALVDTCRQVDPHYTYTNNENIDMEEEGKTDDVDCNGGERYPDVMSYVNYTDK